MPQYPISHQGDNQSYLFGFKLHLITLTEQNQHSVLVINQMTRKQQKTPESVFTCLPLIKKFWFGGWLII